MDEFFSPAKPKPGKKILPEGIKNQLDFDLAFFGDILSRSPSYVDVLRCQAELLTLKGKNEEALVLDRRLAELCSEDSVVRYNLACSLALMGKNSEAIEVLDQALELGYDDVQWMLQDDDLKQLREHPKFLELAQRRGISLS